jgi:hypothetical protein
MKIKKISAMVVLFLVIVVSLSQAALLDNYLTVTGVVTLQAPQPPDINVPIHIAQCLKNGWKNYTRLDGSLFENQGQCVSYVATNMCKDNGWKILTRDDGSKFNNQGQCVSYFVRYAEDIQFKLNELVIEEEIVVVNVIEEFENEFVVEEDIQNENIELNSTIYVDLKLIYYNNMSYTFLCDNDFNANKYDWYFGDATTIMDSEKAIEHNFTMEGLMYATCYATNTITTESAHSTISILIE